MDLAGLEESGIEGTSNLPGSKWIHRREREADDAYAGRGVAVFEGFAMELRFRIHHQSAIRCLHVGFVSKNQHP
jgi:hypothetical protein